MHPYDLACILASALYSPRYEPVPRKHGGSRVPVWVPHRFPIKGGISLREVMIRQATQPNALLRLITKPEEA